MSSDLPFRSLPPSFCQVGDLAVKVRYSDLDAAAIASSSVQVGEEEDSYLKINIQLEDNIFIVSIIHEDKQNPPFFIENQTKHEIYYGQHIEESKTICCMRRKSQSHTKQISTQVLYPGERKKFTWDEWVTENDHFLGVEIENESVVYNIDKIKDYPPIKIREAADEANKKVADKQTVDCCSLTDILPACLPTFLPTLSPSLSQKAINKQFLYKKGKIGIASKAVDPYEKRFCILDVYQQKMKVYDEKKEIAGVVINLKVNKRSLVY